MGNQWSLDQEATENGINLSIFQPLSEFTTKAKNQRQLKTAQRLIRSEEWELLSERGQS
jgi:hypothetical protein